MTLAHPPGVQVAALPVGESGPRCQCVRRHRPMPAEEEIHHIVPTGAPFHGPDVPDNTVPVCPTTHSSIHALLRVYLKARRTGKLDPNATAHYSPYVRRLVRVALDHLDAKEAPP